MNFIHSCKIWSRPLSDEEIYTEFRAPAGNGDEIETFHWRLCPMSPRTLTVMQGDELKAWFEDEEKAQLHVQVTPETTSKELVAAVKELDPDYGIEIMEAVK